MGENFITYKDVTTRQVVDAWGKDKDFVVEEQLTLHLEERFGISSVHVIAAIDQGDFVLLQLTTNCWREPREFALLSDGALSW
jgi:hypothetical protein